MGGFQSPVSGFSAVKGLTNQPVIIDARDLGRGLFVVPRGGGDCSDDEVVLKK